MFSPPRHWRRRLTLLLALSCLLVCSYLSRGFLLTQLAQAYIVDDPLSRADVIVIPGGGVGWRPIEAVRLYHDGIASKILIMDVKADTAVDAGVREPEASAMRLVLIKKGVPDADIVTVGKAVANTYADIKAVCDWAQTSSVKRVLIVTDLFHTRRARWVANNVLGQAGIESRIRAVTPPEYCVTNWWKREEGLITFQNELLKFGFYLFKY